MKIVDVVKLQNCGRFANSSYWLRTRAKIRRAVRNVDWPPGSGKFTIYPESGKKRGEGNGVKPIKSGLMVELKSQGWQIEGEARGLMGKQFGAFDAVLPTPHGHIVLEWETGNISSSHRSLNKMSLFLLDKQIVAGILVVPSRAFYKFLTDRIGNITELEPYLRLWQAIPCKNGILEILVIEYDAMSRKVARIPKGTDGRAKY